MIAAAVWAILRCDGGRSAQCRGDHVADGAGVAEDHRGLGAPRLALLGQGARFVFGLPGFQGGLLAQRQRFRGARFTPVVGLERLGQLGHPRSDCAAPRGEPLVERGGDADDLADRPQAFGGVTAVGEAQRQRRPEVALQPGVVHLRRGDGRPEQRPPIQRQPLPCQGADLVADRDMGVQVGVTGAAVAVGEPRCDEPLGVDLGDAVGAGAGEAGLVLEKVQGVVDRPVVAFLDDAGHLDGGQRPQRRHAFDRAEGEVVPGGGGRQFAGLAGDETAQFAVVTGRPPILLREQFPGDAGFHLRPQRAVDGGVPGLAQAEVVIPVGHRESPVQFGFAGVDPEGPAQFHRGRRPGLTGLSLHQSVGQCHRVGVQPQPEQAAHLILGDRRAFRYRPQRLNLRRRLFDPAWQLGQAFRCPRRQRLVRCLLVVESPRGGTQSGQAPAGPHPRGLALGAVVVAQRGAALGGRVRGRHLPHQIQISVPGGQFVDAHHRRIHLMNRTLRQVGDGPPSLPSRTVLTSSYPTVT